MIPFVDYYNSINFFVPCTQCNFLSNNPNLHYWPGTVCHVLTPARMEKKNIQITITITNYQLSTQFLLYKNLNRFEINDENFNQIFLLNSIYKKPALSFFIHRKVHPVRSIYYKRIVTIQISSFNVPSRVDVKPNNHISLQYVLCI